MDVEFNELAVIRIRLDLEDMEILASGETLLADLDRCLQLEIYHFPAMQYPNDKLNGE